MSTKKLQDPPLLGSKKHKLGLLLSEKEQNAILAQKIGSDLDQYAQLRTVDNNLLKYIWSVTLDRDEGLRALCGIYAIREGADCFYWLAMLRIPLKLDTDSTANWTPIPRQTDHSNS
jgi:hypothetical protein